MVNVTTEPGTKDNSELDGISSDINKAWISHLNRSDELTPDIRETINIYSKVLRSLGLPGITRAITKFIIMTLPYGGTVQGIRNHLLAKHTEFVKLYAKASNSRMKTIHERVKAIYSGYTFTNFATALRNDLKAWMPELVDVLNYWIKLAGLRPLTWTTPSGFTVIQSPVKQEDFNPVSCEVISIIFVNSK
uniref:DNA-dependent RNA polymerase n=1 Tax=Spizellomyces sp. 'palustris' TaxID=117820 RepID=UPI0010FC384E|nr:DNA-dependent RNA polymerase [Spizellomyces sp. 'palustris']QCQ69039.1 DNA-dependent RNA polymerase [Spizellomyces sp. 'palustris']